MRYLIVAPRYIEKPGGYYEFPLGLAYISSCLKKEGVPVVCLNLNEHEKPQFELLKEMIETYDIDVVCTGGLSVHYHKIKRILSDTKRIRREIVTIVGGGLVGSEPELVLGNMQIDIGVVGEGEETIVEIANALEKNDWRLNNIKGIVYRAPQGGIIKNEVRPAIKDIDRIPFPDYEGLGIEKYLDLQLPNDNYYLYPFDRPRAIPVVSSRSCPFKCTFCYHPIGNKYRERSLDNFFDEIAYLKEKYQINLLVILDELFNTNSKRAEAFCQRISEFDVKWIAQMRVDIVNSDILERMKAAGLFYISYGLESASDIVLKSMKKKTRVKQIESALAQTREKKIGIQGNFIFGDPAETTETAEETFAWWKAHSQYQINMTPVIPYPGSENYRFCIEKGIIEDRLEFIEKECHSVNMTRMTGPDYSGVFNKIFAYLYKYRMYGIDPEAQQIIFDNDKKSFVYRLNVTCPHCGEKNIYDNFHLRAPGAFKLGCRFCNQRFDLLPNVFTHIRESLSRNAKILWELQESQQPVSVTPCIPEAAFFDIMEQHQVDWEKINIRYVLDADTKKAGQRYLGKHQVLKRQKDIVSENCMGHIFVVLPAYHTKEIIDQLRNEFKIPANRILQLAVSNI